MIWIPNCEEQEETLTLDFLTRMFRVLDRRWVGAIYFTESLRYYLLDAGDGEEPTFQKLFQTDNLFITARGVAKYLARRAMQDQESASEVS